MGNCLSADDPVSLRDLVTRPDGPPERNITIIAVGGAVNTLLLRTRASTGDVDFFYRTKTKHEDVSQVIVAANTAASSLKLGDHWLNNHTAVFIEEGTIQQLYDEAVQQNDVVFQAAGLTVYAAPWRYALGTKLDRLSKTGARPYVMSDAVGYLVQLIQKRKGAAVKKSEIKKWAQDFKFTVPNDKLVDQLAAEYKKKTGKDGVING